MFSFFKPDNELHLNISCVVQCTKMIHIKLILDNGYIKYYVEIKSIELKY